MKNKKTVTNEQNVSGFVEAVQGAINEYAGKMTWNDLIASLEIIKVNVIRAYESTLDK